MDPKLTVGASNVLRSSSSRSIVAVTVGMSGVVMSMSRIACEELKPTSKRSTGNVATHSS